MYGPVLVVPEPAVDERVMTIPGIGGRKMSKSYGNQIPLSATPGEIRRLVFRIVTDSRSPAEPKDPDTIFALYRHLPPPQPPATWLAGTGRAGSAMPRLRRWWPRPSRA